MSTRPLSVLLSWIGKKDLEAAQEQRPAGDLGPIARTIKAGAYEYVYLLNDHSGEEGALFEGWLRRLGNSRIQVLPSPLPDGPTDYKSIFQVSRAAIRTIEKELGKNIRLTYLMSAGTPAMQAVFILLATVFHPGNLVESSREKEVQTVNLPFELSADFLPDLIPIIDERVIREAQKRVDESSDFEKIIGNCPQIRIVKQQAAQLSVHNVPVLILGETGTGKELFARAIHATSSFKKGNFVAVNCNAIPADLFESEMFGYKKGAFTGAAEDTKGLIEQANEGTLFLDEIGEMPPAMQVKLLRVLQEKQFRPVGETVDRKVEFRLVTATHQDLFQLVKADKFREDFLYRIAVGVISLPPLRERSGDLQLLSRKRVKELNAEFYGQPESQPKTLSAGALKMMGQHTWPGNIRELINTLTRAVIFSHHDKITYEDIEDALLIPRAASKENILNRPLGERFSLDQVVDEIYVHYLEKAHQEAAGNKTKAARLLGMKNYQNYMNKRKKYGLP